MPTTQWYTVYKAKLALQETPDMVGLKFDTVIFVETNAQGPGTGIKHHIAVDNLGRKYYNSELCPNQDQSEHFYSKRLIGYTKSSIYPHHFDRVLGELSTPLEPGAVNARTMHGQGVKPWSPLDMPGEHRWLWEEWVEQQAIPALERERLVEKSQWIASLPWLYS